MTLEASRDTILREALAARAGRSFERALGRAVRRHGGDYSDYVAIVTEVREYGRSRKLDLRAAARALSDQP